MPATDPGFTIVKVSKSTSLSFNSALPDTVPSSLTVALSFSTDGATLLEPMLMNTESESLNAPPVPVLPLSLVVMVSVSLPVAEPAT